MVNKLYKPKSAVGTVLMAEYTTVFWGDSEEEAEWNVILEGAFDKTGQHVTDLARWNAPGAKALETAFAGITKEATSTVTDYRNLVDNFKKVQGAAQAAHDDWQTHGALRDFLAKEWKAVAGRYRFVKDLDRRWVDKDLYAAFLVAERDFLVPFAARRYEDAGQALGALKAQMQRVVDAARERTQKKDALAKEYDVASKRKEKFETDIWNILWDDRAEAFKGNAELNTQLRAVRIDDIAARHALQTMPNDAQTRVDNFGEQLDRLEAGLKAFDNQHPKPKKPDLADLSQSPESPEGSADLPVFFQMREILPLPPDVKKKYDAVRDAVLPREQGGELEGLRQNVKTAYTAAEDAPMEARDGLIAKFGAAHDSFMQALDRVDAVAGPSAQLAAARIADLADAGLLAIMSVDDRLKLLRKLRGSCQPLARAEKPFKLSGLGEAQAKLLASFSMDEEFRKVDRGRRKQIAKALVAGAEDKREYKQAQGGWADMPEEERIKICRKIVATQCTVLGIKACPVELADREASNGGSLDLESRVIFINKHPQAAFHHSFEEVSNTLFHETSHLWQLVMVDAFNEGKLDKQSPEYLQILLFAENRSDKHPSAYVDSGQDSAGYKKQPMEAHAFEVGDETQRLFMKALLH